MQQSQNHNQPQPSHQQSPYPPVQHQQSQQHPPQQHHQPGGAYGQQQTQNGYGANDGPPTVRSLIRGCRPPGRTPQLSAWRLSTSTRPEREYQPLLTPSLLLSTFPLRPSFPHHRLTPSALPRLISLLPATTSLSLHAQHRHISTTAFARERHPRRWTPPPLSTYHHHAHLPAMYYLIPAFLRPLPSTYLKFIPFFFGNLNRAKNQDMMNAQNQQYVGLRSLFLSLYDHIWKLMILRIDQAIQAGDMGARCSRDSQSAYQAGDGAKAKELSIEANEHRRMQDVYDGQAAQWIYDRSSLSRPSFESC